MCEHTNLDHISCSCIVCLLLYYLIVSIKYGLMLYVFCCDFHIICDHIICPHHVYMHHVVL